ncbi:MAG: anaerobic ribonucleoside-triphosphate reductase activating protein [Thiothrix sp.]|uniref:anaerobic ribonucleoside-triphosphate reductase activating protein n=1 Tax=Thiothrix sp. TaxID=1032 RepID=UPI00263433C7|nr:anaerobic ribonucleoside-triphosphate reductase activating protein [Thiothrix sp.]MDD5395508.1 anaerobic ribonucleoside-triphosphate reductase activating protein [Thiothrix sp.]
MLQLGGLVPLTSIDFPGHLAAVLFCQGCPWHCRYCHNPHLLRTDVPGKLEWAEVMHFLRERAGFLDGVVFSGGEPLLQPRLPEAMQAVKALGFKVALHTAGIMPARLAKVLPYVDWVGLDIKAPFHAYKKVTGLAGSGFKAEESLDLLLAAKHVDYEIRTTVDSSLLSKEEVAMLTAALAKRGVKRHVLQACRKPEDKLLLK